jgi:hypothetical protein
LEQVERKKRVSVIVYETYLSEIENLKNTIESMKKEVDSHKKYNLQLEEMLPNSKKKKLGIEIIEEDTPKVEVKKEQTVFNNVTPLTFESAGGTF